MKRLHKLWSGILGQAMISAVINAVIFLFSIIRVYFFSKGLSVEHFGVLSLMLTISAFGTYYFSFASFQYVFREASSETNRFQAFKTALLLTLGIGVFSIAVFLLLGKNIATAFGVAGYEDVLLLNLSATFLMAILMLLSFFRFGQAKNNEYNIIQMLRQVPWIMVCFLVYTFLGSIDLKTVFIIINISLVLSILISLKKSELVGLIRTAGTDFRGLFQYTFPLLPYYLGIWGIPMIIRTFISVNLGHDSVALYSVSYTMIDIVVMFISSVMSTLTPYFFSASVEQDAKLLYNRIIKFSCVGTFFCLFIVVLFKNEIVSFVTSEAYLAAADYLVYLAPLALLKIVALTFEQYYLKQALTKQLGMVYLASIVLTLICAEFTIRSLGITGAIITSFIPFVVHIIFLYPSQRQFFDVQLLRLKKLIGVIVFLLLTVSLLIFLDLPMLWKLPASLVVLFLSLRSFDLFDEKESGLLKKYLIK